MLHLLLSGIVLILRILLDEFRLFSLQVSDRLVNVHFFLVKCGLVFNAPVEEQTELVGLVDAVDEHGEQGHFLLIAQFLSEVSWLDTCELFGYFCDFFIKGTKNVRLLTACIHKNQSDNLRPELLLVFDDLVQGCKDVLLLFALGSL